MAARCFRYSRCRHTWGSDSSGRPTGFLILWVKDGYLSALEHAWVTEEMPQEFPSVERLRRWRSDETHTTTPPIRIGIVRPFDWILFIVAIAAIATGVYINQ